MVSKKEKGDQYESFVANVYNAIIKCGAADGQNKTIQLFQKHKLPDPDGNPREIDIYWEYEIAGEVFKVGIECKNYKNPIPVNKIEAFATKIKALGLSRGIFVTKVGYQKSALSTAKRNQISLMVIKDVTEDDLNDRIKEFDIIIDFSFPARITYLSCIFDKEWHETNTSLKEGDPIHLRGPCDQIIIEDIDRDEKYSLFNLENNEFRQSEPGDHEWQRIYQNAFIIHPQGKNKIKQLNLKYSKANNFKVKSTITDTNYYIAVLKYINQDGKVQILRSDENGNYSLV